MTAAMVSAVDVAMHVARRVMMVVRARFVRTRMVMAVVVACAIMRMLVVAVMTMAAMRPQMRRWSGWRHGASRDGGRRVGTGVVASRTRDHGIRSWGYQSVMMMVCATAVACSWAALLQGCVARLLSRVHAHTARPRAKGRREKGASLSPPARRTISGTNECTHLSSDRHSADRRLDTLVMTCNAHS